MVFLSFDQVEIKKKNLNVFGGEWGWPWKGMKEWNNDVVYVFILQIWLFLFFTLTPKKGWNFSAVEKTGIWKFKHIPRIPWLFFYLDWNVKVTVEKDEKWDRLSGFLSDNLCRLLQLNARALEMSFQLKARIFSLLVVKM